MSHRDYYLKCIGFFKKESERTKELRFVSWLLFAPHAKEGTTINTFWPLNKSDSEVYKGPEFEQLVEWNKKFRALKTYKYE